MSASVLVTTRRLTAAAAVAAAAVGALAVPAAAADHLPRGSADRVVISRVQYDSASRGDRSNRSLNREWVEISNNSRHDVNLSGWTLSDEAGRTYTFPRFRLNGQATVRVHTGFGRDTQGDLYQGRRYEVWDDYADTATLRNDRGRFISAASWGDHPRHIVDHRRYDDDRRDHGRFDDRRMGDRRYDDRRIDERRYEGGHA
ncbi:MULTISPECIES: lamin tail domain-containing protein [Streptomyces]|uniref:lamin tail domain-containing protein n=1 Tax=Streptomyces herbicida TaxID=3065675 RepID=UPI002931649D|nr:lamin tail domain-containing protein [Streptomyces sp. NEAU-HV9]